MSTSDLITAIEEFAARRGIAPATVTSRAVSNSQLYARLKSGGSVTMRIADRLRSYMETQEAETPEGAER